MSTYDLPANKNGRVYAPGVLRKMVEDAKPRIKAGQMIGEVEPPGDSLSRMSHASHVVRDMKVDRLGRVVGTIEFLDTPAGRTAEAMMKAQSPHGSLRSEAIVDENGVVTDMKPISFDVTMMEPAYEPSAVDQLADIVAEDEDED